MEDTWYDERTGGRKADRRQDPSYVTLNTVAITETDYIFEVLRGSYQSFIRKGGSVERFRGGVRRKAREGSHTLREHEHPMSVADVAQLRVQGFLQTTNCYTSVRAAPMHDEFTILYKALPDPVLEYRGTEQWHAALEDYVRSTQPMEAKKDLPDRNFLMLRQDDVMSVKHMPTDATAQWLFGSHVEAYAELMKQWKHSSLYVSVKKPFNEYEIFGTEDYPLHLDRLGGMWPGGEKFRVDKEHHRVGVEALAVCEPLIKVSKDIVLDGKTYWEGSERWPLFDEGAGIERTPLT